MLLDVEILHNLISEITPILGVGVENNSYRVDYVDTPTAEQLNQINNIISNLPLEKAKIEKLAQIDQDWETIVQNGWTTAYGWKLGISTQDVALLNGNFTLAKEASAMGINAPIFIIDTDGNSHNLTLQELTILMLQYGQARASLSSQDANRRKAVKLAISIDELASI
jgi:hypothetical protein